jgi:hypothetical protein
MFVKHNICSLLFCWAETWEEWMGHANTSKRLRGSGPRLSWAPRPLIRPPWWTAERPTNLLSRLDYCSSTIPKSFLKDTLAVAVRPLQILESSQKEEDLKKQTVKYIYDPNNLTERNHACISTVPEPEEQPLAGSGPASAPAPARLAACYVGLYLYHGTIHAGRSAGSMHARCQMDMLPWSTR